MDTLSVTTSLLTHSLAWALLFSLWQGLLLYGVLFAISKALPGAYARVKYSLSLIACAALFLWFANTWLVQYQKLKGVTVYITEPSNDNGNGTAYTVKTIAFDQAPDPVLHHIVPAFERFFPFIILIYSMGLVFMLLRFGVNIIQVNSLGRKGVSVTDAHWNNFVNRWQQQLNIARPVQLFLSDRVTTPMMLGVIKPIILLPVTTFTHLSTEQVESILLHELAHIKRHDYLLNILQTIAETILFFNPFIWLISSIARREREHCCDDLVISCSANPLPYARALAILEYNRLHSARLTLAATGDKKQLFHRIKRIMEMKKSNINYSQLTIALVAIIVIVFSTAMFTFSPSFAQKAKGSGVDTSGTKKSVYKYKSVTIDSNGKRTEIVKESPTPLKEKIQDEDEDKVNIDISVDGDGKSSTTKVYSGNKDDLSDIQNTIKEIIISSKDIAEAVAGTELPEIEKELERARKEINDVDWNEVSAEINRSLAEVNKVLNDPKRKKEISIQIRKELEHSKEEMAKAEREMKKIRKIRVEASAHNGNATAIAIDSDEEAQAGSNDFEAMLNLMEKDGLINRSATYRIEKRNDNLLIDGVKQPDVVLNKYRKYLNGKTITIKGHKGSLNINVND